jgi:hypothetical protein
VLGFNIKLESWNRIDVVGRVRDRSLDPPPIKHIPQTTAVRIIKIHLALANRKLF